MKRPLAVSAIALIAGIMLADANVSHVWAMVSACFIISAFLLLYRVNKDKLSRLLFLAIPFLLLGYLIHTLNIEYHESALKPWGGQEVTVEGRIFNEPEFVNGKIRFQFELKKIEGAVNKSPQKARILVTLFSEQPLEEFSYGVILKIRGELNLPQGKRNFGGFDNRKYLAAKEISAIMSVQPNTVVVLREANTSWLKKTGYIMRRNIIETINRYLPAKEASVLAGMLIGYTNDMPEEMEEDFRRAGISHVLAVSGANILFLLMPLLWLLKRLGFNRRWSSAIAFPLMIFYVFLTGMEASIIRAAIMAGVTLTGMILWRRTDVFCSMAVSAIIILVQNTYMLYDMGFILSFCATLSLVVFYKPLFEKMPVKIPKGVRDTLSGTLAAQIGVIPIIAYCFNTFSLVSVFTNLIVVPITGFFTVLGALLSIFGAFFSWLGYILGFMTRITAVIIIFLTETIAKIQWAEINIATPDMLLIVLYYFIALYLRYGNSRLQKSIAKPLLACILVFCGTIMIFISIPRHTLRICFADVGQGDCIIIRTPENKNIIIDGGGSINDVKGSYAGERIVVPLLYDLNITRIDLMIATHGHADHIGGLETVLDKIKVERLAVADAPDNELEGLLAYAKSKNVDIIKAREGDTLFTEKGLSLKALYPLKESWKMPQGALINANELSLVTRLDYGGFSSLFTGDIGFETELRLLNDNSKIACDLLKVGHHGSKYSTCDAFIKAVNPGLGIVMVGRNRYGHPSPDTLERLRKNGIKTYQTMDNGAVSVEIEKESTKMKVTTMW